MAMTGDFSTPTLAVAIVGVLLVLLSPRIINWTRPNRLTTEVVSLHIYPIKSCRGFQVPKTKLRLQGLDLDRQWMFVDAKTHEFLTIRQLPQMTQINTALSPDGASLLLTITGSKDVVRIPAHPDPAWLAAHTTSVQVKIWDTVTDGYAYGAEVNAPFARFLARDLCLVYKGPSPRVLRGNADPRLLGRVQTTNFPDVHPVLIASLASLEELNSRLSVRGVDAITVERFRPNIVVRGDGPWSEDSWRLVRIGASEPGGVERPLDLDVVARCARCQVPNVDPDTAVKDKREPWDTLMSYRRVDEGMKHKPCFGMLSAPRNEGVIEVGMKFEVLEETTQHRYIKGF